MKPIVTMLNVLREILPKPVKQKAKSILGMPATRIHPDWKILDVVSNLEESSIVFDVGARNGWFSQCWQDYDPLAVVHQFEPEPIAAERLNEKAKHSESIVFNAVGVGETAGELPFYSLSESMVSSSFLQPDKAAWDELRFDQGEVGTSTLPIICLDEYCKTKAIEEIRLIKIDIQGFELKALKGAIETLKKTDYLLVESAIKPLYHDSASFTQVHDFMVQQGFHLQSILDSLTLTLLTKMFKQSVLFVAPSAYPLGGVAVWLDYLLKGLKDKNVDVHLGLLSGTFHKAKQYIDQRDIDYSWLNIIEITSTTSTNEGRVISVMSAIKQVNADIVLSVNVPDVYEASSRLKADWKPALKAVMTLHALEPDYFLDIKKYSKQIDAVITTNRLTQKMVIDWGGFPAERSLYAPYGVEGVIGSNVQIPSKLSTKDPIKLLYAGRIDSEQKRIEDLLLLLGKLDKSELTYQLKIAGDGPQKDTVLQQIQEQIQKTNTKSTFEYLGVLSQQALFEQAFKTSDVLLLFSDWETGPIIIWEAMMHQLAIVTSQYCGLKTEGALQHNDNALVFPIGDIDAAAQQLQRLISEKDLYTRLLTNAEQLVNERYSRRQSVEEWFGVLNLIANDISSKSSSSMKSTWAKNGLIERMFGHMVGHYLRRILNKPAFNNSAGDEWSHSMSLATEKEKEQFMVKLKQVEVE